jgi:tetratricopeptide (TPR) repeat protein
MTLEEATRFLTRDCVFSNPISTGAAEEIWRRHRSIVESMPGACASLQSILPMSDTDLKAARKFRSRHAREHSVVDVVRLNPMDLVVHQHWISPTLAEKYQSSTAPERWFQTALLDPPSSAPQTARRDGNSVVFDLPHSEFLLGGPSGPQGLLQVCEPKAFVTVAFHANRAVLVSGYHRAFALVKHLLEAVNPPRGVLFAVSNALDLMGSDADDVRALMEQPRPPRLADFFDPQVYFPVTLRKRRYQMRIQYEVVEVEAEEESGLASEESKHFAENGLLESSARSLLALAASTSSPRSAAELKEAEVIFEEAVRLQQAGRNNEAIAAYQHGLDIVPRHAAAHSNLSAALLAQGRIQEAARQAEQAVFLDPGSANAHINLGFANEAEGKISTASRCYQQALAIDPNHAPALSNFGYILGLQGDPEGALNHIRRAIAINADFPEAHFNLAENKTFSKDDPDLGALESLADRKDLAEKDAVYVHFALAKALEDVKEWDRAFEHLRNGNEIKRAQVPYDESKTGALFQRVSDTFDRELLDRLKGTGNSSSVPIFVIGMPRSGSTLVEQILSSHPGIHAAGELDHLDMIVKSVLDAETRTVKYPEFLSHPDAGAIGQLAEAYLSMLPKPANGKCRVVDKMPANFIYAGLIHVMFPDARIIHTMRDPIDTCVSCYSKLFRSGQYFSYDLAELGRYYRWYSDLMTHWRSVLPSYSILDVHYEQVVDDLEGQARRLIGYCGLEWDDRCLDFHKTVRTVNTASSAQVRKPLYRTSVERWRRFEKFLDPLVNELQVELAASN